ncbi:MAG: (Fe-S)-binding protein [Candidatus Eisenbacteria bacterium]
MSGDAGHTPADRGPAGGWFDSDDPPRQLGLDTCIHCGLCLTACPTYRTLKTEPDSPRGRVYLMRGLAEGTLTADATVVRHLDRCLDCRACETACPAGVPYSQMLEATRGQLARRVRRSSPARLVAGFVLSHVLPHRGRVAAVADLLRLGQSKPVRALLASPGVEPLLPDFVRRGLATAPVVPSRGERALERVYATLPHGSRMERRDGALVFSPPGPPRLRVGFHATCVMEALFPHTHRESVRLLVLAGAEVRLPDAQTCCGALHAHDGRRDEARALARTNARAFAGTCDVVVSHSAGCGAALRDAAHTCAGDATVAGFAACVRDLSEVLEQLGLPFAGARPLAAPGGARPLRVAYHDPCHLAHAQKVREAPRRLVRALPGVEYVELPNADWCCGSAGAYHLTQPELADAQLEQKLDAIARVAPDVVVASNPGCLLHVQRGLAARGQAVRLAHLADLLGEAFSA